MGVNCVEMPDTGYVGMMVNYNDEDIAMSMEQCCAMMLTKCMGIAEASAGAKVGVMVRVLVLVRALGLGTGLSTGPGLGAADDCDGGLSGLLDDGWVLCGAVGVGTRCVVCGVWWA